MWHVSSRSGVATLRTAIHLLLTYYVNSALHLSTHTLLTTNSNATTTSVNFFYKIQVHVSPVNVTFTVPALQCFDAVGWAAFTTIHSILLVQFTCMTVLCHNLSPGPLWSSSWSGALYFILHAFLHPIIISFCSICPSQPVLL